MSGQSEGFGVVLVKLDAVRGERQDVLVDVGRPEAYLGVVSLLPTAPAIYQQLRQYGRDIDLGLLGRGREPTRDPRLHAGQEDLVAELLPALLGLVHRHD